MQYAGFHAKFGMATLSIDGPGHGLGMDDLQIELSRSIMRNYDLDEQRANNIRAQLEARQAK